MIFRNEHFLGRKLPNSTPLNYELLLRELQLKRFQTLGLFQNAFCFFAKDYCFNKGLNNLYA